MPPAQEVIGQVEASEHVQTDAGEADSCDQMVIHFQTIISCAQDFPARLGMAGMYLTCSN